MYRKSMALYSYFWKQGLYSFGVTLEGKNKYLYQNFKFYNVKGFATLGYRGGGSVKC